MNYSEFITRCVHIENSAAASSATLGSSTAVCRGYYTTSSTGSTSQTEDDSSSPASPCWCIGVFMERLRCTWWTAAHQPPTFRTGRQHLRSASQRKLIVPRYRLNSFGRRFSLSQARRPGIRYLTVFTVSSRHFLWNIDEMYSAHLLTMRYINLHFTYLLTYIYTQGLLS